MIDRAALFSLNANKSKKQYSNIAEEEEEVEVEKGKAKQ